LKNRPSGFGIESLPRIVRGQGSYDIGARAFADGLICYPCSGNVDGTAGDTIIIAPPYNAGDGELEEIVTKLVRAVDAALSGA
jgi:adenosylmethionine-8-amino-7-oxononanoate aminotransferase